MRLLVQVQPDLPSKIKFENLKKILYNILYKIFKILNKKFEILNII